MKKLFFRRSSAQAPASQQQARDQEQPRDLPPALPPKDAVSAKPVTRAVPNKAAEVALPDSVAQAVRCSEPLQPITNARELSELGRHHSGSVLELANDVDGTGEGNGKAGAAEDLPVRRPALYDSAPRQVAFAQSPEKPKHKRAPSSRPTSGIYEHANVPARPATTASVLPVDIPPLYSFARPTASSAAKAKQGARPAASWVDAGSSSTSLHRRRAVSSGGCALPEQRLLLSTGAVTPIILTQESDPIDGATGQRFPSDGRPPRMGNSSEHLARSSPFMVSSSAFATNDHSSRRQSQLYVSKSAVEDSTRRLSGSSLRMGPRRRLTTSEDDLTSLSDLPSPSNAAPSWSQMTQEELVLNIGSRERTRQEVLWEIVASEER